VLRVGIKIYQGKRALNQAARSVVTENKRRYTKDGWNLDLTYITDRVLVMSLPAMGAKSLYRNHIDDVARFLDSYHPHGYLVINCCAESYGDYPVDKFHGWVKRYKVEDHSVPTLPTLVELCQELVPWMEDPRHVIVIHCKGGKGRSGTAICAWLLHTGQCTTPEEALNLFGCMRTDSTKKGRIQGVETASQQRYVRYFHQVVLAKGKLPDPIWLVLNKCVLRVVSKDNLAHFRYQIGSFISVTHTNGMPVKGMRLYRKSESAIGVDWTGEFSSEEPAIIVNDSKIMIFLEDKTQTSGLTKEICCCSFWLHTSFVKGPYMKLTKGDVDRNRKWPNNPFIKVSVFELELFFCHH